MDMSSMSGMGMGSMGMFTGTNMAIARGFWYTVAAVVAVRFGGRLCNLLLTYTAKRRFQHRSAVPSRPSHLPTQVYETVVTVCRELSYPQLRPFTGAVSKYFNPPTLGHFLVLAAYWIMVLVMLWANVILTPSSSMYAYKWEKVGFRAAWVSVTQIPLLYCLGGKQNAISLVTGISYERLNWLHRWVARTVFFAVIVHWSYFFTEWSIADIVNAELQLMPMVKYGFGAWGVLGWSVITGFGLFRNMGYELWVVQHLASAGVLLWLLHVHVPSYAQYNIWLAIGFVAFDRGFRTIWSIAHNFAWPMMSTRKAGSPMIGFAAHVEALSHGYLRVQIRDVNFPWAPGQHLYISIPTCGFWESHPFSIATESPSRSKDSANSIDLYVKAHSGFTKRLARKAASAATSSDLSSGTYSTRIFVSTPLGSAPLSVIERCNSLILAASSTGTSFTLPILEHAIKEARFVQRISFYWIIRHAEQLQWFRKRLTAARRAAEAANIEFNIQIFITGSSAGAGDSMDFAVGNDNTAAQLEKSRSRPESLTSMTSSTESSSSQLLSPDSGERATSGAINEKHLPTNKDTTERIRSLKPRDTLPVTYGRPTSWDGLIYPTVAQSEGETAILACGGRTMMADIRNYVAALSDERAVHKGTGAQGLFLFTETYGW